VILKRDGSVTAEQLNAHNANVIRVVKKLKAAGIVKPQHVVAKVEIPTAASLVAQPVMAAQPVVAQTVVEIQPIIEVATATEEHSTPATAIVTGTVEETPTMTADQGYQAAE